jgi:energy-coupling factor transporter ATP-binding protein EcfA2
MPLDTTNPEAPTFTTEELQITILGGVKLGGLDKLRVTLKIEKEEQAPIRQNLDLYHSSQVTKLVEQIAGLYGLPTETIQQTIEQLTSDLEAWRMNQLELLSKPKPEKPTLTATEKTKATKWLKAPKLMERTQDLLGQAGMVGEEVNRLLLWLVMSSRKTVRPLHAVSLASSGIGKTHLQQTLAGLLPPEDVLEVTSLSGNALYYFKGDELRHKLLLIEDLDGADEVLYPLRELQSKGRLSKTVAVKGPRGTLRTEILEVEGPVSVAAATTKETIYTDNANRALLLTLDESPEQDKRILDYQRRLASGKVDIEKQEEAKRILRASQRMLNPVRVENPFAQSLQLPNQVFTQRRANQLYLDLVGAITFYHQHQRETKNGAVQTALEDIEWANKLAAPVLLRKSDELSGACRSFLEELKFHLKRNNLESFTAKDIRRPMRIAYSTLSRYLRELRQGGYLEVAGGDQKHGFAFQIAQPDEYEHLKNGVENALAEAAQSLKAAQ